MEGTAEVWALIEHKGENSKPNMVSILYPASSYLSIEIVPCSFSYSWHRNVILLQNLGLNMVTVLDQLRVQQVVVLGEGAGANIGTRSAGGGTRGG
jgi:hypothetical protein